MPHLRTLALSDFHLGRKGSRLQHPDQLAPLVEGFERILLLGDILDHWYLKHGEAPALEHRVREVCRKAGAHQVVWFRGNHDAATEEGEEYAVLHGVLYLHGHALYHRLGKHGSLAERIRALNARKFGQRRVGSRADKTHWGLISEAYERLPQGLLRPFVWNWATRRRVRRLAGEAANGEEIQAVVFGHSHLPGVRRVGNLTVFNLGGWMKNVHACGFMREGRHCRLVRIEHGRGQPHWGRVQAQLEIT